MEKEQRVKVGPPREQKAEQPEKKNAVTEVEAVVLDQDLRAAAETATASMARVALLVQEAKDKEIWKLLTDPKTGQRYQTWQHYIGSVLGRSMEPLAAVNRNALIKMLLDEGLSQRAAAEAVNTSPATVNEVAKGGSPGERKPRPKPDAQPPVPQPRRPLSARVGDFLDEVSRRMDEIATADLENLDKKLQALHRQCAATLKLRAKTTPADPSNKQERDAAKQRHPAGSKTPDKPDAAA